MTRQGGPQRKITRKITAGFVAVIYQPRGGVFPQVRGRFGKITAKITGKITLISDARDFPAFPQVRKSRAKSRPKITHPPSFRKGA